MEVTDLCSLKPGQEQIKTLLEYTREVVFGELLLNKLFSYIIKMQSLPFFIIINKQT